jgi:hypothetical protein
VDTRVTPRWRAYHLHYHGDRDRLLLEFVRPTVADLLASKQIETFFFVRYALRGPHIRLRLRPNEATFDTVHEAVTSAAACFFTQSPSSATLPDHIVRETSEQVRATDPHEHDTEVYADNTCVSAEPHFEVARYGGAAAFVRSLDYFALSSVHALDVCESGGPSRLAAALRSYVWQAWGFARDGTEFAGLIEYTRVYWEHLWRATAEEADAFFERRKERICQLLRNELEAIAANGTDEDSPTLNSLADGAQLVAAPMPATERELRLSVAMSHLHMTSNRMGLTNIEEAYVGRILWRAVHETATASQAWWEELWQGPRRTPVADLRALRSDGCARLCHAPRSSGKMGGAV